MRIASYSQCVSIVLQSASVCKTWAGEGDALAGALQAAGDIDFYVDVDLRWISMPTPSAVLALVPAPPVSQAPIPVHLQAVLLRLHL